jgi:bifunctional DNA-binding transcriptional regulator/antitoxin component of YhaV-PrlF toxin-antitoxin module
LTIPQSVREKAGLRVGDRAEVTADDAGRITARKLQTETMTPLNFGEEFAKKHGITAAKIARLTRRVRKETFREEYEGRSDRTS